MKPCGRSIALEADRGGDLALDLVDLGYLFDSAAEIVRDVRDGRAALVKIEQVIHIHGGPGLVGIDHLQPRWGTLTQTQRHTEDIGHADPEAQSVGRVQKCHSADFWARHSCW
jgi:hypothetical protein